MIRASARKSVAGSSNCQQRKSGCPALGASRLEFHAERRPDERGMKEELKEGSFDLLISVRLEVL